MLILDRLRIYGLQCRQSSVEYVVEFSVRVYDLTLEIRD